MGLKGACLESQAHSKMSRIHLKSHLIRPPAKPIQSSRSFSIDSNGLREMLCGTAGSSCLAEQELLKNDGVWEQSRWPLRAFIPWCSLVPFSRGRAEGLCWEKAAQGLGWGCSGEEVMPQGRRNSGKQAGGVSPIFPAASFG